MMPVFHSFFHTLSTDAVGGEVISLKWLRFLVVKLIYLIPGVLNAP
jgi:hypothetical protein